MKKLLILVAVVVLVLGARVTNAQALGLGGDLGADVSMPITVAILGIGLLGMVCIAVRKKMLEKRTMHRIKS
jgi:hypothetical protein